MSLCSWRQLGLRRLKSPLSSLYLSKLTSSRYLSSMGTSRMHMSIYPVIKHVVMLNNELNMKETKLPFIQLNCVISCTLREDITPLWQLNVIVRVLSLRIHEKMDIYRRPLHSIKLFCKVMFVRLFLQSNAVSKFDVLLPSLRQKWWPSLDVVVA